MTHLLTAHELWKNHLKPSDFALDLTCGNGHDTLFLASLTPEGRVFGVDLQSAAIAQTAERTKDCKNVELFQLSHPKLPPIPRPPRLVVYNLGYLPGGDKAITTKTESTIESLDAIHKLLAEDGAISITCYPGHDEGRIEEAAIVSWVSQLPSHNWSVCHHRWLNRHRAPSLIWIKREMSPHQPKSIQSGYEA